MSDGVYELAAHERMTPPECLAKVSREFPDMQDVIVVGFGADGGLVIRSSAMLRKDAVWLLLAALDHARGIA